MKSTLLRYGVVSLLLLVSGCDREPDVQTAEATVSETAIPQITLRASEPPHDHSRFNLSNNKYLFDVSDHSIEELEALLVRAEKISQTSENMNPDLDIVMILHGPDIEWFTDKNAEQNKKLIDLAKKLDAYEVIDMKVCETAMESQGLKREEIPAFIESVPYAPDTIKETLQQGYINL